MKKAWPWAVGLFAAVAYFGYFETMAFLYPGKYDTLSHTVATIGAGWPLAIWFCGVFAGGLAAHFFWPWQENPMGKGGG